MEVDLFEGNIIYSLDIQTWKLISMGQGVFSCFVKFRRTKNVYGPLI